jgi:cell wall-associated NlpC family hydrolase
VANWLARRVLIAGVSVAACAAAVIVPSVASAAPEAKPKPTPTISSVEATLAKLAKQNTLLVEKYDEAQIAIATAKNAVSSADHVVAVANVALASASADLSRSALAEYEGGSFSTAGALLASNGDSSYLDTLDTMQMISEHSAQVVSAYTVATQTAHAAKTKADAAAAAATKARDAVAAQQATVRTQVKKYSTMLATLTVAQRTTFQARINPAATAAEKQAVELTLPDITSAGVRAAVTFALAQVGKPYSWGAAGPGSYDCSGLTMAAYRKAGVSLPHSAADQYHYGHHVSFSQLQPGDLMFFYRPTIGHVTMYIGDGLMVSAPETGEDVKVMPADSFGSDFVGATRLIGS